MDPIANLREQLDLAQRIVEHGRRGHVMSSLIADGERLAELVLALDEWRSNGGFDPYGATS